MSIGDLTSGYHKVVQQVVQYGSAVAPRGEITREVLGFQLNIDSTNNVLPVGSNRGVNTRLADELAKQLIGGVYIPERLKFASPHFVDDDQLENYGPLIAPSVFRAVEYLKEDPSSRRAVANLGHTGGDSGYPCTISLGWVIRGGCLHGFSEMRSQDVWLGLPYDIYMFAALQRTIANSLAVRPGRMFHRVRSMHIYERDVEASYDLAYGRAYKTLEFYWLDWAENVKAARDSLDAS